MATPTTTVHLIANAHLDPVWLWPWQAGLDEALATCRTMCDLLDQYPEFVFTAGEAWRYHQIEAVDPELFGRIQAHAAAGRWALVGGWWIQPDCNFPSGFGLERQISTGKRYFLDRFGVFPEVAYNVDSFGHAATLPGIMRAAGQRFYVMMRPQEHEMELPARLFRWRGYDDTPEVLTFRIAGSYCTGPGAPDAGHLRRACHPLPEGIRDTMCFIGVGDHGGGATRALIEWVRENADRLDGLHLQFSSPARFFAAVAGQAERLPLVTGELQYHAVGCYSVVRGIKTRVRRAEHLLRQAELVAGPEAEPRLHEAWQRLAFNHFHDILGGTSLPSAYAQQYEYLGAAAATADEVLHQSLRRRLLALPPDPCQRIALLNASDLPYEGYVEHEPWLHGGRWHAGRRLLDAHDQEVHYQTTQSECVNMWHPRLAFHVRLQPGDLQTFRLDSQPATPVPPGVHAAWDELAAGHTRLAFGANPGLHLPGDVHLALPRLDLIEDGTDNWSHSVDRYPEGPVASPHWDAPAHLDAGPLMAATAQTGRVGDSTLRAEWRVYAHEPFVELRLSVHWRERCRLLKLVVPMPAAVSRRRDGIPGGHLVRPANGREHPLRDWTLLECGPRTLAVVSPDIYAVDVSPWRARFTLLRSPLQTHHDPNLGLAPRFRLADQGEHEFRVRFLAGDGLSPEVLDRHAAMLHRPPVAADLTRGMPPL